MRLSPSAFLWAAFSHQLFVTTSAGQQFGRFGNRFRRSNISVSSEVEDASPSPTDSLWTDASISATGDSNRHSVTADDTSSQGVHATTSLPSQDSGDPYTPSSSTKDPYTWGANHTSLAPNSTSSMTTPSSSSNSRTLSTITKSRPSPPTTTSSSSFTITSISLDPIDECFSTSQGAPTTVFSLIYTETITWYGSPEDYTGIEDVTPTACNYDTPVILISPVTPATTTTGGRSKGAQLTSTVAFSAGIETYTFATTAKHPSVYYASSSMPDYGGSHPLTVDEHSSAKGRTASVPDYKTTAAQQVQESSSTDVRVVVRPTEVVIGTLTVTNNPVSPTTNTVTVGTDVFVVGPSSIVGAGATITRPGAVNNPATTTTIGGIGIVVSSTQAVIDGSTFSIGSTPTTQVVRGQTLTVGPSGVSISGVTVPVVSDTPQTQVVIAGAELITAIGPSVVVVDGTSYTYGQGSATITKVIDDDTVYIGPSGVVVDGTTLGGITVVNSKTQYQIVGGVTISELGASVVVIEGTTWTIGPGTGTTTTAIGGETITIGPSGVEVGTTMTLSYPFGPTSTTTIHPGSAATTAKASATAVSSDDEEDSGLTVGMRRNFVLALFTTCIAIGVGIFGYIF